MSVGENPLQSWGTLQRGVLLYGLGREKPKYSKDIARITFDMYKQNPRDLFGSLNIQATFYGLYSMSCDIQGLGPKKVLRSETNMFYFPLPTASVPNSFSSAHPRSPPVSSALWRAPAPSSMASSQSSDCLISALQGAPPMDLHTAARPGPHVTWNFLHPSPCSRRGWAMAAGSPSSLLRTLNFCS